MRWCGRKRFYNLSRNFFDKVHKKVKKGYAFVACIEEEFDQELPEAAKALVWTGATLGDSKTDLLGILDSG